MQAEGQQDANTCAYNDLAHEITYAQSHGFGGLSLVPGTEPFSSPI